MGASTGDGLRALMTSGTDARTRGLLIEAGRMADRLDDLDQIIAGSDGAESLKFMAEARQQAAAFKSILAQLGVPKVEAIVERRKSGVDELRDRRAARSAEREAEATGTAPS